MHGAGNVAAVFIGGIAAHVDHNKARLSQLLLQRVGINEQRMVHGCPSTRSGPGTEAVIDHNVVLHAGDHFQVVSVS
jgi:hypothetical protein